MGLGYRDGRTDGIGDGALSFGIGGFLCVWAWRTFLTEIPVYDYSSPGLGWPCGALAVFRLSVLVLENIPKFTLLWYHTPPGLGGYFRDTIYVLHTTLQIFRTERSGHLCESKKRQGRKRHTTPRIRWPSPNQLLVWRSLVYRWESGRDPEFPSTYSRI